MYESFFQLAQRPFLSIPSAGNFFPAAGHERARQALARAIQRAEGPGLLIGRAGLGKTLLLQVLAEQFRPQFKVALLASTRLVTRRALLQNILFELGLPYRDREEGELRLALIDHLAPSPHCPNGLVLLIDEAHHLPIRLLEEVRMITNLVRDGQPRVRLVLAGSLVLEEQFANPKLESLSQRIAARCYLEPLTRDETQQYIAWQIRQAGGDAQQIFTADAFQAVHTAADGIPRLINQLCDHVLLSAVAQGAGRVSAAIVSEAWAELQQLPAPHGEPTAAPAMQGSIVEFGQLSDESQIAAPPAGRDLSQRLDAMQSAVAQAGQDWPAEEHLAAGGPGGFQPPGPLKTEVELIFHPPHNPFAEAYQQEEVVIDPYAALETLRHRPKVRSAEGSELSSLLAQATSEAPDDSAMQPPVAMPSIAADSQFASPAEFAHVSPMTAPQAMSEEDEYVAGPDLVSPPDEVEETPDVVLPPVDASPAEPDIVRPPLSVVARDPLAIDDRDILVIEDEEEEVAPPPNSGRARRQEYRQLFARLRRG